MQAKTQLNNHDYISLSGNCGCLPVSSTYQPTYDTMSMAGSMAGSDCPMAGGIAVNLTCTCLLWWLVATCTLSCNRFVHTHVQSHVPSHVHYTTMLLLCL